MSHKKKLYRKPQCKNVASGGVKRLEDKDILTRNDITCQNSKKCLDFRLNIPTLKHKLSMWRHRKQLKIYLENSKFKVERNKKERNQSFFILVYASIERR